MRSHEKLWQKTPGQLLDLYCGYLRRDEKRKKELAWVAHATARNAMAGKRMQSYKDLLRELGVSGAPSAAQKDINRLGQEAEQIWQNSRYS